METTSYAGIDYGLGRSNIDRETGIRYGVISQNSINLDCSQDWEYDYGKPHCPSCGNEIKASDDETLFADWDAEENGELDADGTPEWFDGQDFTCVACKSCYWSDSVYSNEPLGWTYEGDGYKLTDCLDNDIFVLKSQYFTYAQFCSPCVPGACNLDSPLPITMDGSDVASAGHPKCYALGPDWFDHSNPMPYRCFQVADGVEVFMEG